MEYWNNLSLENLSEIYEGELIVEEWSAVVGYEGLYEVSSFGRIKSIRNKRKVLIIRQQDDFKRGYSKVRIYRNGIGETYSVHRIAALAFIPNPDDLPEVNHKLGNKKDNRISELEWATSSKNQQHAYDILDRNKPLLGKFGKDHPTSLKVNQYDLSGGFIKTWDSIKDIDRAGIGRVGAIIRCLKGRSKSNQSKGFKWEYA